MRTLLRILEQAPAAEALRLGSRRLTYDGLARRAASFAAELRRRELDDGHRVAVHLGRSLETAPVLLGCWIAGAVAVPLAEVPEDGRPPWDLLVTQGARGAATATRLRLQDRTLVARAPAAWTGQRLEGVFRRKAPLPDVRRWGHDEPCLLLEGSLVSAEAVDAFVTAWREELAAGAKDRVAWADQLPPSFQYADLLIGLSAGATVLPVPPKRLPAATLSTWVQEQETTLWCSRPGVVVELLHSGLCEPDPPGDLRGVLCAGAPLSDADARDLVRTLPWCRIFSVFDDGSGTVGFELPDWFDPSDPPPRRPLVSILDGAAPDPRTGLRDTA